MRPWLTPIMAKYLSNCRLAFTVTGGGRCRLPTYPEWIQHIITLIDYDTELALAGLQRKSYEPIISALSAIGLQAEAEILNSVTEHISNESLSSSHSKLALNNDYEVFLNKIFLYADNHLQKLNHL